jgi:hypothetical protein
VAVTSLAEVDRQQTITLADHLADNGYAAVDAAYRFTIARAGVQTARQAEGLSAEQVVLGTVECVAHLCDRLQLDPADLFSAALVRRDASLLGGPPAEPSGDLGLGATVISWSTLSAPSTSPDAHARTVLTLLYDRPDGVTSTELRDLGVRNPSNVVMNLIRSGNPIERIQLKRGGNRGREALYRLDRASA